MCNIQFHYNSQITSIIMHLIYIYIYIFKWPRFSHTFTVFPGECKKSTFKRYIFVPQFVMGQMTCPVTLALKSGLKKLVVCWYIKIFTAISKTYSCCLYTLCTFHWPRYLLLKTNLMQNIIFWHITSCSPLKECLK
jgi:hypothetical protein